MAAAAAHFVIIVVLRENVRSTVVFVKYVWENSGVPCCIGIPVA
jgi:hypothetical protein